MVIGILGAAGGVGTTCLTVALANYIAEVKGRRTAVLEVSGKHEIGTILPGEKEFIIRQVQFYGDVRIEQIPELCNSGFEYYILDLGCDYSRVRLEFLRCDKKIIIGSYQIWKRVSYDRIMRELQREQNYKQWLWCLLQFGDKKDKREFASKYHMAAAEFPFLRDPFQVEKNQIAFFEKLI